MSALAHAAEPEVLEQDGITYLLVRTEPKNVRVVWKGGNGKQLRTFTAAKAYLEQKGEKPVMLMNGGIFEPGEIPSGLMVQDGTELLPINQRSGKGNFFLKPNGVFLLRERAAAVVETGEYPPQAHDIRYAVQSGPLLLREGKLHPEFNADSTSRLHRNGVGVTRDGNVVFAMSHPKTEKFPNLHDFASLFRSLGCRNALFLDGTISQMHHGEGGVRKNGQFASIIAVVESEQP